MTGTQPQAVDQSIDAASRFLDRVSALAPADRQRISPDSFGSSPHTSAMMMVVDEVTAMKNKDRQGRVSAFLVELERRVDGMNLSPELGDLVKGAARAILVQNAAGLERATKQLLSPFEGVMPPRAD
jgi:hypothetical protein